jgi:hypothetical protein
VVGLAGGLSIALAGLLAGCNADLGQRVPPSGNSFGTIVFREACERVSYTAELQSQSGLDVSGTAARAMCNSGSAPPGVDPTVQALFMERSNIIIGVDNGVPVELQDPLSGYLRALQPLQDDGTLVTLLQRAGQSLQQLAADDGTVAALAKLNLQGGIRPQETSGGVIRAAAAATSLDDFIGVSLPLLDKGGAGEASFTALLTASAFELRHLDRSTDVPTSPERTPALLRDLLTATRPELATGQSLLVARRDPRGMPLLDQIVDPYLPDMNGLAQANDQGYFIDRLGRALLYQPPLPDLEITTVVPRDAQGRALASNGKPLYQYMELDGSLLSALMVDAPRLFDDSPASGSTTPRDMVLGLTSGASLLAGSRTMLQKTKGGETLNYSGYNRADSPLLDLAHGGVQLLRFGSGGTPPQKDLLTALDGTKTLLGTDAYESPLARTLKALLDARTESKKPIYNSAAIPDQSTLYDDLVPILQRLLAIDNGLLAEDLVAALADPHAQNLGSIMAQLANERGYFFMHQPSTPDEFNNGLDPTAPGATIGTYGQAPDRSAPDSDAGTDWRNLKTNDPQSNRSVMQRLLHLIADTGGGTVFCNGRNASVFSGLVVFDEPCDMFRVDSVGQFFLLSIASPALRSDPTTYAKQQASFLSAINNGNDCRCKAGTGPCRNQVDQTRKCNALQMNILDGQRGDDVLAGLLGVKGFGRYPEPPAAARALFMDLWDPTKQQVPTYTPTQPADLLLNHIVNADSSLSVDTADADGRKFKDGNGVDRLFVDEHNGVLFALEQVRPATTLPDGTPNPNPNDNFYAAMRPLVDAFAKHAECLAHDMNGNCTQAQNGTQLLIDALSVLHKHYPSMRSGNYGRSFAASYGPAVSPDGADSYEPLLAQVLGGDLLVATAQLSPILMGLTTDGMMGSPRALPALIRLGRYVFDPAVGPPGGMFYRDQTKVALRNDGKPAGGTTPFYLLADALKEKKSIFARPENAAAKARWDQAISDLIDVFAQVDVTADTMGKKYKLDNPRLRPIARILLDFAEGRVNSHASDLLGWANQLDTDLGDLLTGPLVTGLVDLATTLDNNDAARGMTYALLRQILDANNPGARTALMVAAVDAVQLLLDDGDLIAIGRGLASLVDPQTGIGQIGVSFMRRGHELEQASDLVPAPKQLLVRLLQTLYRLDAMGRHPMFRISDAIAEVNRATPGVPSDYTSDDYRSILSTTGKFLVEQQRGLMRFINIVQSRCLPGATDPGCPQQ